jgi:hypothetical protein
MSASEEWMSRAFYFQVSTHVRGFSSFMATIILGSQWGDEWMGKLTDYFLTTNSFGVCAWASGEHNAGHDQEYH